MITKKDKYIIMKIILVTLGTFLLLYSVETI
jgi:hypothetical protein